MKRPLKFAWLVALWLVSAAAHGAQPDLIKLTVGYSPISAATLQGTFEFFQPYFPANLRTIEKAMANAIKFLDHPKAKQLDPKQTFNNSYVDEALR